MTPTTPWVDITLSYVCNEPAFRIHPRYGVKEKLFTLLDEECASRDLIVAWICHFFSPMHVTKPPTYLRPKWCQPLGWVDLIAETNQSPCTIRQSSEGSKPIFRACVFRWHFDFSLFRVRVSPILCNTLWFQKGFCRTSP